MNKTVVFSYKRDGLPHSEYQVKKQLEKFLADDSSSYVITTSTASIFYVVRALCHFYSWKLLAYYEDLELRLSEDMRMSQWFLCPDFEIVDTCLEVLLTPNDELKNYKFDI